MNYYLFSVRDLNLTIFFSWIFLHIFSLLTETVFYKCTRVHINSAATPHMYYNVVKFTYNFFSSTSYNPDSMFFFDCFFFVSSPSRFGLALLLYFWCWCKHWNIAVLRKYDRWSRGTKKNTAAAVVVLGRLCRRMRVRYDCKMCKRIKKKQRQRNREKNLHFFQCLNCVVFFLIFS